MLLSGPVAYGGDRLYRGKNMILSWRSLVLIMGAFLGRALASEQTDYRRYEDAQFCDCYVDDGSHILTLLEVEGMPEVSMRDPDISSETQFRTCLQQNWYDPSQGPRWRASGEMWPEQESCYEGVVMSLLSKDLGGDPIGLAAGSESSKLMRRLIRDIRSCRRSNFDRTEGKCWESVQASLEALKTALEARQ